MAEQQTGKTGPGSYGIKPYEQGALQTPTVAYRPAADTDEFHLRDYFGVIRRGKWIIFIFLVSVVVTTLIATALAVPQYKSTVVIKLDKHLPGVLNAKNGMPVSEAGYYETQREVLKSRSLAERVIRRLDLQHNAGFMPPATGVGAMLDKAGRALKTAASSVIPGSEAEEKPRERQAKEAGEEIPEYLSNFLVNRLEVIPVKNSQLVTLGVWSHDPGLSMQIANTLAEEYISYDLDSRVEAGREAKDFLQKQIETTKAKVENLEKTMNEYASKNEIIFFDSDKQSVLSRKLSEIATALSTETADRMRKEALYRQIRESGTDNPAILNNSLIQGLKSQHASLEAEYLNLGRTFTPDYPKMQNLKTQLEAVRDRIELEKRNLLKSIESDYKASLKKEAYLKAALDGNKKDVLQFQERAVQYQTLKREVEVNKELHNNLLQRLNEVGVAALNKSTNIQVVDKALVPKAPAKPNRTANLLLSLLFGLSGGVGLAFLVDYFNNSVKDMQEIERRIGLPSLGMIPHQPQLVSEKRPQIASSGFGNPVAEAFRSISTFIVLSSSEKAPKTLLVTSPGEKEGKSTICMNIASALAESMGKVIVIDADMRRPKLHHAFQVDNTAGLSSCLSGSIEFDGPETKLIKPTHVKGLSIMTSGPVQQNPSKLLHSSRMKDLLDALHELYNFVIIDAPPLMGMPDSILLSSMVDGTILVVKAGETPRDAITTAKQIFDHVKGNLLGVVLNGVKKDDLRYGAYSHYFSSYFKE